jgi:hypothetical protein
MAGAFALLAMALVPGAAGASLISPHQVQPQTVSPHALGPAPGSDADSPPAAANPPAAERPPDPPPQPESDPHPPSSGGGPSNSFFPICNLQNPCSREQREAQEILEAKLRQEEEEKYGPFAEHFAEAQMKQEEERVAMTIRLFAGQLLCPLYRKGLNLVAEVKALLQMAGVGSEFLDSALNSLEANLVERSCFTTREP